ncbi:MAG TPA: arylsulfotransferase family protein [Solirubrobacteraceae bacterium]|jgi:hypothetical protein|nr:arylsulfotransferase family protein [Solirubrobacteraceae bacterium]
MRRIALIVLGIAVLAWAVLAIALDSPTLKLGGASANSASPACLPATLVHSAALAGTGVDVSPAPGSGMANPRTQISFLGAPASAIREVAVVGARSGAHPGRLEGYSQGDGASFVPDTSFAAGERVSVRATIAADSADGGTANSAAGPDSAGAKRVAFSFRVDTPYPTAHVPEFPAPPTAPADYQSFSTLPGVQAPILTVTVPDRDPGAGDILTTNGPGPGQYGPLIYTPSGKLIWFERLPSGITAEDLNEQTYEGARDLTWWRGRVLSLGFGQGEDLVMNSRYQTVARVMGGNGLPADLHDFQLAPHGVAYITAFNPILCNLSSAAGTLDGAIIDTAIQEIDMKTGLVRWEWHSLDHLAVSESESSPPKGSPWDWFHLNSIDPQPDGDLFISARTTWAGYLLQGATGTVLWHLGGLKSSFKMGRGTQTAWQHDGRILPSGEVTFFDDGSNPPEHSQSRGVRIALDRKTHEARLRVAYTHPNPALLAASQGNMQTLPDGNALVGYGAVPAISEYSAADRALLFDAHLPYDMTFYRAFRFPWSARPATPPAVLANMNSTEEETIVHASWNGATEVAAWRVLAGASPTTLTPQATMAASGFESSTILPKKHAYAAVQALDAAGRVIGVSTTARTIGYYASLSY